MKCKVEAILDKDFEPISLKIKEMKERTKDRGQDIVIAVERSNNLVYAYKTRILESGIDDKFNYDFVSRIVKTILWIAGGFKIIISGSKEVYEKIKEDYKVGGVREFDTNFMEGVYERKFEVVYTDLEKAPETSKTSISIGRHLEGSRIGFDAGGSDRKVSAVKDGKSVYSEEVIWAPKLNSNPKYHFDEIYQAFKTAAEKLEKVDAIGVSTAGVCIDNKIMVASLFIKVSKEDFDKYVKTIYLDAAHKLSQELGYPIPIQVANDGDVTALAGAMNLNVNSLLGIAMGTSEAGGYIDNEGNITGYLNELAFVPIDFNKNAMVDEWSGDFGCGVKYFSQDAVIKLAPAAKIELEENLTPAEKLKVVQDLLKENNIGAKKIYETIGVYLGYGIAYYHEFYNLAHVLLMGRVTSGMGGEIITEKAREVLEKEFPELNIQIHLPDESSRRVGQSLAAASLFEVE